LRHNPANPGWADRDRFVVLDYGKKIGDGPPDEVRSNPEVIKAYLGVAD
jgi:branched-chain amino acid transport system ATP-binding protein